MDLAALRLPDPSALVFLAEAAPQGNPGPESFKMFGFMAIMLVMMYFLLFRPQQKKQKEHQQMLKTLRAGDQVVTSGGIVGTVTSVKEKTVVIRSAADDKTKLEITKGSVGEILERSGDASEPSKS